MANGGFKAFALEVVGIVGSGAMLADKMKRCKEVLAALGDGLVGLGQGWSYDAGKTASGDAAILHGESGSPQSYSLYFRHSSGAKMMLSYNVYGSGLEYTQFIQSASYISWDSRLCGGLAVSLAPASCGEYDPSSTSPVPEDALRLHGNTYSTSSANVAPSFLNDGGTRNVIKYILVVRGTQIIIITKKPGDASNYYATFAGEIADCAHSSDTHDYSRFASVSVTPGYASGNSELSPPDIGNAGAFNVTDSYYYAQFYTCAGVLKSGYEGRCSVNGVRTAQACTGAGANSVRWFPVMLYAPGQNDGQGVMENDGFKGFVNREVCCITRNGLLSTGQLLDGGNFIYLAGGLIIGWDPSNDVTLL